MKEKNKPEEEVLIELKDIIGGKPKKERPYLHLEDAEIQEMISAYRKLLRLESTQEKDLIKEKMEVLEKELLRRNKLTTKKQ